MKTTHIVLLFALIGIMFLNAGCITFGNGADGTATDQIARVSYGGWIWKTWRVELLNDHPIGDGSGGTIAQRYGVEDDAKLLSDLQHYQDTGERVKIYYHGRIFVFDWQFSDAETIYKVESMNKTK